MSLICYFINGTNFKINKALGKFILCYSGKETKFQNCDIFSAEWEIKVIPEKGLRIMDPEDIC